MLFMYSMCVMIILIGTTVIWSLDDHDPKN